MGGWIPERITIHRSPITNRGHGQGHVIQEDRMKKIALIICAIPKRNNGRWRPPIGLSSMVRPLILPLKYRATMKGRNGLTCSKPGTRRTSFHCHSFRREIHIFPRTMWNPSFRKKVSMELSQYDEDLWDLQNRGLLVKLDSSKEKGESFYLIFKS